MYLLFAEDCKSYSKCTLATIGAKNLIEQTDTHSFLEDQLTKRLEGYWKSKYWTEEKDWVTGRKINKRSWGRRKEARE